MLTGRGVVKRIVDFVNPPFNWIGQVHTLKGLGLVVEGDRMTEHFRRSADTRIPIAWQRVKRQR